MSFSAYALSDMLSDMQKTYSMFTSKDDVKYEARGLVQPVWYRFSENAQETITSGTSERLKLQINGTAVPLGMNTNSAEALEPSGMLLAVQEGTFYCDKMATAGCSVQIKVGDEKPIVAYAKIDGNVSGKFMTIDSDVTRQIINDINKTAKSDTNNKHIYIEVPFFVTGNKEFKFGLIETPIKVK
ncbi:hypothetical protein K1U96_004849 [Salmonella enterica subsp. enterica serovar Eko]|nr:hypothetical protein [Salmonella enterica subsp. enterica serovar Eko]EHV9733077.1 hypothetical protein [Salmonella enterica subsp. enterica serovar Eko]